MMAPWAETCATLYDQQTQLCTVKCERDVVFDRKTKLMNSTNTQKDAFLKEEIHIFVSVLN
jgi:hypothetical protein